MTLLQLLIALEEAGVAEICSDGQDVNLWTKQPLDSTLSEAIQFHKKTLVKMLTRCSEPDCE